MSLQAQILANASLELHRCSRDDSLIHKSLVYKPLIPTTHGVDEDGQKKSNSLEKDNR